MRELDRRALQGFVSWLAAYRGPRGRLSDRSIANAVGPLRLCLENASREGLIEEEAVGVWCCHADAGGGDGTSNKGAS